MAEQDDVNGLILSNLARLAARLSQVSGDLRAVRGLLEASRGGAEGADAEPPVKRAARVALDLCEMIGKLDAGDAWKVMEVMKKGLAVQILALEQRKAAAHA